MSMMSSLKKQSSKISELAKDHVSLKSRTSYISLAGGDMDWARAKTPLIPDDQLQLTEAELQEEIARVLTVHNTRVPDSLVEWSWKLREFIKLPDPPNIVTLLSIPGTILRKDSEEAKIQLENHGEEFTARQDDMLDKYADEDYEEYGEYEELDETDEFQRGRPKKIPNQFNFCERAALTYDNPMRVSLLKTKYFMDGNEVLIFLQNMSTQTLPPPIATFNTHVFQWTIFDEYQEDYMLQQRERERERRLPIVHVRREETKQKEQMETIEMYDRMLKAAKTLERMVNQNIYDEIAQDYRYWNDPSDEYKDGEGSLLPLWKFNYEPTKKHDITDVCFNARYYDLFAVAYGTLTFNSSIKNGSVCLFSLKNPSYPEWICQTESPVMCLDFSVQHPHLLVIGVKDGSVAVYNIMLPPTEPQYKSNDVTQKHGGIVWEIRWAPDTQEGNLAFYSVSIDSKINYWVLNQKELSLTTVMTLFLDRPPIPGPDGTLITLKGCGTCITFYPSDEHVFLVGTEEGNIYKCNTAYSSIYVQTYNEAHNMPVYRIVFNKYNSKIFASCSGDWRIKIWEDERPDPLFMFDLGVPIGDVQWAPYSSTVLACVSNDGKVTVFDLNVNKYRSICSQAIVSKKKNKLTRLAFNTKLPFIIVGDDKGTINTLKLSPNLRLKIKPTKKQLHLTDAELERMKLEKLLSFIREPPILIPPKDVKLE
ncbi:dynein intermediate chain 2, ciliary isoform X1 [Vespula pensylvanica]|uniref:dynein intermediate chain 2, ciliary isoform X1 n=2 Tax=Vespula pensylvanica TaxID=30213 RepID=UPI001CB9E5C5|nr:dynein intermediate chain 2, ciliary isoform X1 [Vespula pensylvanica]